MARMGRWFVEFFQNHSKRPDDVLRRKDSATGPDKSHVIDWRTVDHVYTLAPIDFEYPKIHFEIELYHASI